MAIASIAVVLGQAEAWSGFGATHRQGPPWAEALLFGVTGALLVLRRVKPLLCLAMIAGVSLISFSLVGSPEGLGVSVPPLIAAYSVARWETRHASWWGLVLIVVLWVGWDGLDPVNTTVQLHAAGLIWLFPWVISFLVGALVLSQVRGLEHRRQSREAQAARAVAEERSHIARELHDVVGHSVSVMTVQASAVRRRLSPEQDVERRALETVEAVGREALGEMRRMVGMLRDPGADSSRQPLPGLGQIDALVEKLRSAGLPAQVTTRGGVRPMPRGLELTAYRVVQESLTNVLRHATGLRTADVHIVFDATTLRIVVLDDGINAGPPQPDGHGLLGLRERVALFGGELVARRRPSRGFEVVATLPLEQS
jgi:signal transduction histidine kinase